MSMAAQPLEDCYIPEPNTGCWLWTGALRGRDRGYGAKSGSSNGKKWTKSAHRFMYEKLVGPIAAGLTLDHICRQPSCVNPRHLEPVTIRTNTIRGVSASAQNARKTHCLNGHPLFGSNLYFYKNTRRICRECAKLRSSRRLA